MLKILANKESLMTSAHKLYLSLHKLFSETVPKEDTKVMHKHHYNSFYRLMSVEFYKHLVSQLFCKPIKDLESVSYRTAFIVVTFVRTRIVEMEVTTFMQQAEAAANEVETQPFRQSDGGRGNISYVAKLIHLRKQSVKRIL